MRWIAAVFATLGLLAPTPPPNAPAESPADRLIETARDYALQTLYDTASVLLQVGYAAARQQRDSCTQARLGAELGRIQGARTLFGSTPATGTHKLLEETRQAARACGDPAVMADAADALARLHDRAAAEAAPPAFAFARRLLAQTLGYRTQEPASSQ